MDKELFYKSICKKYINTMSKEMLLEIDNKILHIFIEDDYIDLKLDGKINNKNYKQYLDEDFETHTYFSYAQLYNDLIKYDILSDIKDLGLIDNKNEWNFYLSFDELKQIGYGYMLEKYYPLLKRHILEEDKVSDFFNHFSLEQLNDFEESLHLYYETNDIDADEWGVLYSKSNNDFNYNIIAVSEGTLDFNDFMKDYKSESNCTEKDEECEEDSL